MRLFNFIFLLMVYAIHTQGQTILAKKWDRRYGGANRDVIGSLLQTSDRGYLLAGTSNSPVSGDKTQPDWDTVYQSNDFWIIKIDSLGNKQWDRRYGGQGDELLYSAIQIADGGYVLGGWSGSGADGDKTQPCWGGYDDWIIKIDSLGNKQWDKRYGGFNNDLLTSVISTRDGGYLLQSSSNSPISGDKTQGNWDITYNWSDFWIVKVDSVGNKQWDKRFGGTNYEGSRPALLSLDGGYLLGGSSCSGISGDKTQPNWDTISYTTDYWVVKIDSMGNKQWDKRFGGSGNDNLNAMQRTNDGGYILGGNSSSGASGDKTQPNWDTSDYATDYWLVKIDGAGNKLWDKRYGGLDFDILYSLQVTSDGGFLLAGNTRSNAEGDKTENNLGFEQTWVVKTDSVGNKLWDKTMFTIESSYGYAIETKEGCYAIANTTGGGIAGYKTQTNWSDSAGNFWMIVFCDSTVTGIKDFTTSLQLNIYPSPFTSELDISIIQPNLQQADFSICNILGQTVYSQHETNLSPNYTKMLDLHYLPNGVYLVEVVMDGVVTVKEVIKQ